MSLGPDGALVRLPKNALRKKFPQEGYTPAAAALMQYKTTALGENGFELLDSFLTCDPAQRSTAKAALYHDWFTTEPLPVALSRSEIRQLRRNRDEAISSGAHMMALAQQQAKTASRKAADNAAAIAAQIKERLAWAK